MADDAPPGPAPLANLAGVLDPIIDTLESGLLLVDHDGRIGTCSLGMATILGRDPTELIGRTMAEFNACVLSLMDNPPAVLAARGLFPDKGPVLCEEFEIVHPTRSVVRWVARRVRGQPYAFVAVCTDITLNVDLTVAYERMALTDRLTGIANRRGVEQEIQHELLRLQRYQTPVSFLMFDIDHFKNVNDTHGHTAGDDVLRSVAQILAKSIRETDLVARWGGEEFLIILPDTPHNGAMICAERIRMSIERAPLQIPVTISAGVHQALPGEPLDHILAMTDQRLYQAKNSGRNRVC